MLLVQLNLESSQEELDNEASQFILLLIDGFCFRPDELDGERVVINEI